MPLGEKYFSTQPRWKQRAVLFVCVRHGRSLFKFLPLFIAVSVSDSDQDFGPRLLIGDERTKRNFGCGWSVVPNKKGKKCLHRFVQRSCKTMFCSEKVRDAEKR